MSEGWGQPLQVLTAYVALEILFNTSTNGGVAAEYSLP